jgi:hypothetical protein
MNASAHECRAVVSVQMGSAQAYPGAKMSSHRIGHRYDDSAAAIEKKSATHPSRSRIRLLPMCYLRESVRKPYHLGG